MSRKNVSTNWRSLPQNTKGIWSERLACAVLTLKGFRILTRRYRTPLGEVDIIAARGNTLIAIEVKYRQDYETAALSITPHQRQRIIQGLKFFLSHHPYPWQTIRFDVILVSPWRWPQHIQNAWLVEEKS